MTWQTGWWRLASAPFLLVAASVGRGDDAAARETVAKLLEVGWGTTPQARAAADAQLQQLAISGGGDKRVTTAAWLVLLQQRRYEDALKRLDEHLVRVPDDLQAWRAKAWVHALLKNYPASMLAAATLSQQMADAPSTGESETAAHNELIGFLGRLFGYFGGPVSSALNQEQRKAAERQIVARIEDSRQALFEDAVSGVLTKYVSMTDESADARDKAEAAAIAERERTLQEVEADRQAAGARAAELDERRKKLQAEFRDELDDIAKEDRPLVQELAQLESRAAVINRDLLTYSAEINRLTQLAAGENDPVRRQQLLFEADRLSVIATRIDGELLGLNRLARGIRGQRQALAARQNQAQATTGSQVQRIERELNDLAKREKRNEGIEKRASRPSAVPSSKVRSLSVQATALSTYDQLPLEAWKISLLESLRE